MARAAPQARPSAPNYRAATGWGSGRSIGGHSRKHGTERRPSPTLPSCRAKGQIQAEREAEARRVAARARLDGDVRGALADGLSAEEVAKIVARALREGGMLARADRMVGAVRAARPEPMADAAMGSESPSHSRASDGNKRPARKRTITWRNVTPRSRQIPNRDIGTDLRR